MKYNYSTEDFIRLAKEIHGDKYDYSKSEYSLWKNDVIIICPIHGEFSQSPQLHIGRKNGCPKCRWEKRNKTCIEKYGVENPFASKDIMTESVIEKQKESRLSSFKEKYGVSNPSQMDSVKKKKELTSLNKYGVKSWAQSDEGRKRLHKIVSSDEVQSKIKSTCIKKYGVSSSLLIPSVREKQIESIRSDAYKKKRSEISSSDEFQTKAWNKKIENGTANTSSYEEKFYEFLCEKLGANDIVRNYRCDRYPYRCDFYIKSKDMFIELNIHWSHGGHEFDCKNQQDLDKLKLWSNKLNQHKKQYGTAITVWTVKDKEKIKTAKQNNLNYIVLWNRKDIEKFYESWGF